jgi:hypothetical protein
VLDDNSDFDYHWFEHLYAWNRLLDKAGYVDYQFMDTETKRLRTYAALLMLADDRWATVDEVEQAAELGDGSMEGVLIGLSYMREVVVELFDDGELCYQLTDFGRSWANMLLMEHEQKAL